MVGDVASKQLELGVGAGAAGVLDSEVEGRRNLKIYSHIEAVPSFRVVNARPDA
jgi:hypothetical protein